jgi:hypothetical protein
LSDTSLWDGVYARRWKYAAPGLPQMGVASESKVHPFALRWKRVTRSVREAQRIFSQQVEDRYSTVNLVEVNDRWNPMCTAVKLAGAEWPDVKDFFLTSRHSLVGVTFLCTPFCSGIHRSSSVHPIHGSACGIAEVSVQHLLFSVLTRRFK